MIVNQAALAGIYKNFNTVFQKAFADAPEIFRQVTMLATSTGRSNDYTWLANFPMLREWLGDRVIKDISGFHYEIVNRHFEGTIEVDRNDIEDDQIGLYRPMVENLAYMARTHPDHLVFTLLAAGDSTVCYDGQYFFDTDHEVGGASVSNWGGGSGNLWVLMDVSRPVKPMIFQRRTTPKLVRVDREDGDSVFMRRKYRYGVDYRGNVGFGFWQMAYGSKQTLDVGSYASARAAMIAFKNDEGVPLGITPNLLVVGPSNEAKGREILKIDGGGENPWYNSAELLVVPWLD